VQDGEADNVRSLKGARVARKPASK
jgi:hypothetical protein